MFGKLIKGVVETTVETVGKGVARSNVVKDVVVNGVKNAHVNGKSKYYSGKVSQIPYIVECDKAVAVDKKAREAKEVITAKDVDAYAKFMASRK
jgi:type IV secretory pathway TrbF-like protein